VAVKLASYILEWKPAGSWVAITSAMLAGATISMETTGNRANALAFGDATEPRATIPVKDTLAATAWENVPIRLTPTLDGTTAQVFGGIIVGRTRTNASMVFECEGWATLIRKTSKAIYSPALYRRPAATKTTATSIEDPTDPDYAAGLTNYALWQCGGRPYEQAATYTTATFYYSCDQSVLAPVWSWLAGEDAWAELLKLAQASGGQIYQGPDGVVYYRQVLGVADLTTSATFTESNYTDITERADTDQHFTKLTCAYIPRAARPLQEVVSDATFRLVHIGETVAITLEPQWPLKSLEQASAGQLKSDTIVAVYLDSTIVNQGASGYTHTLDIAAQRIIITITNTSGRPFAIHQIKLQGEPITADEAGSVSVGSGTIVGAALEGDAAVYIQSQEDAERLCGMALAFYSTVRPIYTLTNIAHDPSLKVGNVISLTNARFGLSGVLCVLLSTKLDKAGVVGTYEVSPITGLPKASDFYIVGTNYTGQTKQLGY